MDKRIIYKQDNGAIAIITPSSKQTRTINEIAKKDVPTGLKYKIVEDSEIPDDQTFRDAWRVDLADLTDGVGE